MKLTRLEKDASKMRRVQKAVEAIGYAGQRLGQECVREWHLRGAETSLKEALAHVRRARKLL